jgi:predicted transcriptional regulator
MAKIAYNTRLDEDLVKQFKILAILQSKRQNELLEEAIKDLLKKHEKNIKNNL